MRRSPFFHHLQLQDGPGAARRAPASGRRRRLLCSALALVVGAALALAGALWLSGPRPPSLSSWWHHHNHSAPPAKAAVVGQEPGSVDLQVEHGRSKQTYRFRRVGKDLVIQDVTPRPQPRRLPWRRPRPAAGASR